MLSMTLDSSAGLLYHYYSEPFEVLVRSDNGTLSYSAISESMYGIFIGYQYS
jgi:hypothetical protein